jgi:AraC-like DNA-binding protein
MEHRAGDELVSVYREYAPEPQLRAYVRALAWYGPAGRRGELRRAARELYVSPQEVLAPSFADAQMSVLFPLGVCYSAGEWRQAPAHGGIVMGALTRAAHLSGDRDGMVAAYLTPRGSAALFEVPAVELNDRTVSIGDLWKGAAIDPECATIEAVEVLLVRRLTSAPVRDSAVRTADLAAHVLRGGGRTTVERMAGLAGVSRQHLARLFREHIGVSPKLYARLARFRHSLREVGRSAPVDTWSQFAARHGYADQSHLIAAFREFTGLTPRQLARGDRFHPFIGDESEGITP